MRFSIPANIDDNIPLVIAFGKIAQSDFDSLAVTVNPQHCDYNEHTGRLQLIAYAREHALTFDTLHVPAGRDFDLTITNSDVRMGAVCNVANIMHAARVLGVRTVILSVTHSIPSPHGSDTASLLRSLEGLIETAEIMGINLAMRNLIDARSLVTLSAALREYDSPRFGFCYDTALDLIADHEPYVLLDQYGERLKAVLFADSDGKIARQLLPFSGAVDWHKVCALLTVYGYSQAVTLNISHPRGAAVLPELADIRERFNQMLLS